MCLTGIFIIFPQVFAAGKLEVVVKCDEGCGRNPSGGMQSALVAKTNTSFSEHWVCLAEKNIS